MATNLRLRPATEAALRERAASSGRSQQELIREALDRYLGLAETLPPRGAQSLDELRAQGRLLPARGPIRWVDEPLDLGGRTSIELLDREDRF
jgi:plasmid stability protein